MSNLTNIYSKVYGYAAQSDTHHILHVSKVFTARCTLVQSAVLRSHVVCLSVRL